jgi:hypothetical protein
LTVFDLKRMMPALTGLITCTRSFSVPPFIVCLAPRP